METQTRPSGYRFNHERLRLTLPREIHKHTRIYERREKKAVASQFKMKHVVESQSLRRAENSFGKSSFKKYRWLSAAASV